MTSAVDGSAVAGAQVPASAAASLAFAKTGTESASALVLPLRRVSGGLHATTLKPPTERARTRRVWFRTARGSEVARCPELATIHGIRGLRPTERMPRRSGTSRARSMTGVADERAGSSSRDYSWYGARFDGSELGDRVCFNCSSDFISPAIGPAYCGAVRRASSSWTNPFVALPTRAL
jgi:hypothetical protein